MARLMGRRGSSAEGGGCTVDSLHSFASAPILLWDECHQVWQRECPEGTADRARGTFGPATCRQHFSEPTQMTPTTVRAKITHRRHRSRH